VVAKFQSSLAAREGELALAEQGNPNAQYSIAACYAEGIGFAQDYEKAVKWYRKAAESGHLEAMRGLAEMYEQGKGVIQDYAEAVKWYRKAADQVVQSSRPQKGKLMNGNQRAVSLCALALIAASVIFAPWEAKFATNEITLTVPTEYSAVWEPPIPRIGAYSSVKLRVESLLMEWATIAIICGGLFVILKDPVASKPDWRGALR